jgi:hypothetical protein
MKSMAEQWMSWEEEHILERLGRAVVAQWDELPEVLQDLILREAVRLDDRGRTATTERQIMAVIEARQSSAAPAVK